MKVPKLTLQILSGLWFPLIIIVVYLISGMLARNLLPSGDQIYTNFANIFAKYGYMIVLIGSILEAALIIDFFIPGGSIIIAGAFFSGQDVLDYPLFLLVCLVGTTIGFIIDYVVGYFGWSGILRKFGLGDHLKNAQSRIDKFGPKAFFLGYVHPDVGSFYAVAAGVLELPIKKFLLYSLPNIFFWLLFWTLPIFIFGSVVKDFLSKYILLITVIIIGIAVIPGIVAKITAEREK